MKLPQPLSRRKVTFLLGGLLAAASLIAARGAELQQAAVTELYKTVSYQASAQAPQRPAAKGTVIHPTNIVRTGVDSRAELQFNDNTITRMGANSVFSFDQQSQTMDLSQGSVLFCKPKTSQTFEIATPAATCSISGTTGFVEYIKPNRRSVTGHGTMIFGLVEGRTTVTINGKQYPLRAGEMLLSTGGIVQKLTFNLLTFTQQAG
ncbi:MAG: FecR family protein [Verrucomicrobiota bacterium]